MKKRYFILLCVVLFISIAVTCVVAYTREYNIDNTIPTNYIAIFRSESAEIVNTTYVYEVKKKKSVSYKYINTTSTTTTYASVATVEEVTKKGTFKKKNKIFEIAKKNNANSYVKYIKDDKIYTIDEFKNIFK